MTLSNDAQLERYRAKVARIKKEIRRLKALQRKRDNEALGKIVRDQHPELAKLLLNSVKQR